nr:hypothetical protein CFP56_30118 [Quercus suber]
MGGEAFRSVSAPGEPTLNIRRLTPEEYTRLKLLYIARIGQFLGSGSEVAALIEAPEKQDHGDIDILIASRNPVNLFELASAVGARGIIAESAILCNLAVPEDGSHAHRPLVVYHKSDRRNSVISTQACVQVDLEVLAPKDLEWNAFNRSYGGVGALIGMMVSPFGFTMSTSRGFVLTLEEHKLVAELKLTIPREEADIVLAKDPQSVMRFLGLSPESYERGFATVQELYAWSGACRVLCQETLARYSDERDRRQRPGYKTFREVWVPANVAPVLPADSTKEARLAFIADRRECEERLAAEVFGKQEEIGTKRVRLVQEIDIAASLLLLRRMVMQESGLRAGNARLTKTMRGVKHWMGAQPGGFPCTLSAPASQNPGLQLSGLLTEDRKAFRNHEAVRRYVMDNWEILKKLGTMVQVKDRPLTAYLRRPFVPFYAIGACRLLAQQVPRPSGRLRDWVSSLNHVRSSTCAGP